MQFSTVATLAVAAIANAMPAEEVGTITMTNYITKVIAQQTTYVPMAVTFYHEIQNTTTNGTAASNTTTSTNTSIPTNSTQTSASAAAETNAANAASVAGLGLIAGAIALIL